MFNLSEAWKAAYQAYLQEEDERFNEEFTNTFAELEESQKETEKGLNALLEYYNLYALCEGDWTKGNAPVGPIPDTSSKPSSSKKENKKEDKESEKSEKSEKSSSSNTVVDAAATSAIANLTQILKATSERNFVQDDFYDPITAVGKDYQPIAAVRAVQKIGDMKFPANIIFFVKQLIKWVINVVKYYAGKFMNLIRMLIGAPMVELDDKMKKLSLEKEIPPTLVRRIDDAKGDVMKAYAVDSSLLKKYVLAESVTLDEGLIDNIAKSIQASTSEKGVKDIEKGKETIVVNLDFSKDIMDLKQLVSHFFKLFDNAFGSNNEQLFETSDLEILLELFEGLVYGLKTGKVDAYDINGSLAQVEPINSARVYDNLVRTNTNLNNLKAAYQETFTRIQGVARIINSKQMLAASNAGMYRMISAATRSEMVGMLKMINPRLKDAKKMESELGKMQIKYEKIAKSLQDMQKSFMALSSVTFTTNYQKRIADLFNASKYMTQTVTLRLSAIGIYIKQLKDVQAILSALADISIRAAERLK